jgi:hypothetical protein
MSVTCEASTGIILVCVFEFGEEIERVRSSLNVVLEGFRAGFCLAQYIALPSQWYQLLDPTLSIVSIHLNFTQHPSP